MDINRTNMAVLFVGFNKAFKDAFALSDVTYQEWTMTVPSGTSRLSLPFLEQLSGLREWIGPRQKKNIASQKLDLDNRTFEDTIGVPVNDINDDEFGIYTPIFGQMGVAAGNNPGILVNAALVGNGLWLDGAAVFGTSRVYGDNTISNYVTTALSSTTYGTARAAMMSYQGHGNNSLKVVPNILRVGPALEATAKLIVEAESVMTEYSGDSDDATIIDTEAAPNPYKGTAKIVLDTELVGAYANYWFLMDTRGVVKPVIYSDRQKPQLIAKSNITDENVFNDDEVIYGTKARGAAAVAFPHLVYAGYKST